MVCIERRLLRASGLDREASLSNMGCKSHNPPAPQSQARTRVPSGAPASSGHAVESEQPSGARMVMVQRRWEEHPADL